MIYKNLNEVKGIRIRTSKGCTNFGGLDIVGNKLYTIKTNRQNTQSIISVYQSYKSEDRKTHSFSNCFNHGNDITYYGGRLYVAPCAQFVGIVDVETWKYTTVKCDLYVSAITHYKKNKFLLLSDAGGATYKMSIAKIINDKMTVLNSWIINNTMASSGYTISQGIAYNKNNREVYVVFTNIDYMSNVILRSCIFADKPDVCYRSKHSTNGRYELEGIGFGKKGKMILGSNLPSGKDAIFTSDVSINVDAK